MLGHPYKIHPPSPLNLYVYHATRPPVPLQCWQPAQVNLLHTLASSVQQGCVLILTGDYHYADIKVSAEETAEARRSHKW